MQNSAYAPSLDRSPTVADNNNYHNNNRNEMNLQNEDKLSKDFAVISIYNADDNSQNPKIKNKINYGPDTTEKMDTTEKCSETNKNAVRFCNIFFILVFIYLPNKLFKFLCKKICTYIKNNICRLLIMQFLIRLNCASIANSYT